MVYHFIKIDEAFLYQQRCKLINAKNSQRFNALQLGAVEVICKPGSAYSTKNITLDIVKAIRTASVAKVQKHILPTKLSI